MRRIRFIYRVPVSLRTSSDCRLSRIGTLACALTPDSVASPRPEIAFNRAKRLAEVAAPKGADNENIFTDVLLMAGCGKPLQCTSGRNRARLRDYRGRERDDSSANTGRRDLHVTHPRPRW